MSRVAAIVGFGDELSSEDKLAAKIDEDTGYLIAKWVK